MCHTLTVVITGDVLDVFTSNTVTFQLEYMLWLDVLRYIQKQNRRMYIGGQTRADFFKSLHESAKSAVSRLFADFVL